MHGGPETTKLKRPQCSGHRKMQMGQQFWFCYGFALLIEEQKGK